jgi:hypothetical protein
LLQITGPMSIRVRITWNQGNRTMRTLLTLIVWCVLLVLCWPLALLVLVLWPFVWLVSLPFRVLGVTFDAVFALLRALLLLPARILGYRSPA